MKKFLLFCTLITLAWSSYSQTPILDSITHDGLTRTYLLTVPPSYTPGTSVSLVLNLHGLGSSAFEQFIYSRMSQTADAEGFLLVHPDAINAAWNSGIDIISTVDDVGFLLALVDSLASQYSINLDRVYSTGMSNGGFMSYRLACEASDRIAAIASVTGSIATQIYQSCTPTRAVPVLQMHGTLDPVVLYNGAFGYEAIEQVVDFWAGHNNCNLTPQVATVPDTDPTDASTVESEYYGACDNGTEVLFYRIFGGGHTWPGAVINIGTGATNNDIDARPIIWDFFNRHSLAGPTSTEEILPQALAQVMPNPFNDYLRLNIQREGIQSVSLWNALGQLVYQEQRKETYMLGHYEIYTRGLSKGLYILKITTSDEIFTQSLIKN